jgi:hypothetical protein
MNVMLSRRGRAAPLCLALAALGVAHADQLVPPTTFEGSQYLVTSQSWFSTAPSQTPGTVTGTGSGNPGGVSITDLTAAASGTYLFDQSFAVGQGAYAAGTINGNPFGFIDSYVIDVPAAESNASAFSLDLAPSQGLQDLALRLYAYGPSTYSIGNPTSPALAWSSGSNAPGGIGMSSVSLPLGDLAPGLYVLQVAGLETGTAGGSLSGQIGLAPVPVPGTLPLLLGGGFALLGMVFRVRRR